MIRAAESCGCQFQNPGPSIATANICGGTFLVFLSILEEFVRGRCAIADPCNRVVGTPDDLLLDEYDFVVVGAGSAGSVVAGRLSENENFSVLLLEAGDVDPVASRVPSFYRDTWNNPEIDWQYHTQPGNYCLDKGEQGCSWMRGKTLGGSSVLNGMMYHRGHKADYDVDWKEAGVNGWSWEENKKYFDRSEDNKQIGTKVKAENHGVGGPMPIQQFRYTPELAQDVLDAASSLGHSIIDDINDPSTPDGFGIAQAFNDDGQRVTTARAFLKPYWVRPNLHVRVKSLASKVLFEGTTAYGVEYIDENSETRTVKAKKEVILSGGALNSPQLLMLSGVGPREDLEKLGISVVADLPVGQNLLNHIGVNLYFVLEKSENTQALDWPTATEYLLNRTGEMTSTGVTQVTALLYSSYANKSLEQPDIQAFFNSHFAECSATGLVGEPVANSTSKYNRAFFSNAVALKPRSVGYMTLNSTNPTDYPLFYANYFDDPYDMEVMKEASRKIQALVEAANLQDKYSVKVDSSYTLCDGAGEVWSDEWLECTIRTYTDPQNHQLGTTAIGKVVDEDLRVYNVTGVRVIDAGVIPRLPTGNPQAGIMMVAERGAEAISLKWSSHQRNYGKRRPHWK